MKSTFGYVQPAFAIALAAGIVCADSVRADIVVTSTADSGNGTLRQAIQFNESLGGGNTIVFSNIVTGTITLTNPLGELLITKDVTIAGPGAKVLAINGDAAHRVLHVTNDAVVAISGLALTKGAVDFENGGGVLVDSGSLTLADCAISGNGSGNGGGGMSMAGGTLSLVRCSVTENGGFSGGGILQLGGALFLTNCTLALNSAHDGGAIEQVAGTFGAIVNSTIVSNSAASFGGGIANGSGVFVRNTIIAANTVSSGFPSGRDCNGTFISGGFNLIGIVDNSTGWGALGDQLGTTNSPLNPFLGSLADNGGPTPTMAPRRFYSPAIDQGNSGGIFTDQRGRVRPHTNDYVASIPLGGDGSDIGAVELSPITLVVSNANDSGPGSLRQTITAASPEDVDTVSFATNVLGTITLTSGELLITNNINIVGPGAKLLSISGNQNSRVFHSTNGDVSIAGLTITQGTNYLGGGILNEAPARLTISNCTIIANSAIQSGGGIANYYVLTLLNSTVASNTAFGSGFNSARGGGVYNEGDYFWIQNCTISGNVASGGFSAAGGGIENVNAAAVTKLIYYSTIAGNVATNNGNPNSGGVANGSGVPMDLYDSIVAGNAGGSSPDVTGDFSYSTFSLIGIADGSSGLTNGVNACIVGTSNAPVDARLGPLRDNGGPTPTRALMPDSPAVDRGQANFEEDTDQRGAPRAFYFLPDSAITGFTDRSDIGAFELGRPQLAIGKSGNGAIVSWPSYYGDFALQQNGTLSAMNWQAPPQAVTDDGTNRFITIDPPIENAFYRLKN